MRCTHCKRELPDGGTVCPHCAAGGTPVPRVSGMAVVALVMGVLTPVLSLYAAVPAVILAVIALRQVTRSRGRLKGAGFATLGIAVSALFVLFPLSGGSREKARRASCTNNLKQLATQSTCFSSEKNQQLPGANWVAQLGIDSPKVRKCPSENATDTQTTYGYSGLLLLASAVLDPDAGGMNEQVIPYADQVGMLADTGPSEVSAPGIINGGGCMGGGRTVSLSTRHWGVMVGFADGHVKYFPGEALDERDAADPLTRVFVSAPTLGLVDNFGGGYANRPDTVSARIDRIAIGGEYCGRPLVSAIGELFKAVDGRHGVVDRGFRGGLIPGPKEDHLWATTLPGNADATFNEADLTPPADTPVLAHQPIARDAVVLIVAKGARPRVPGLTSAEGARPWITREALRAAFAAGGVPGAYQCYTYGRHSETRLFFEGRLGIGTEGVCRAVRTDAEMVETVATNAHAIGYCSLAMADPARVDVVGIGDNAAAAHYLPNPDPAARQGVWWVLPSEPPVDYPLTRTIYLRCAGKQAVRFKADYNAPGISYRTVLRDGPLFKASYWLPK